MRLINKKNLIILTSILLVIISLVVLKQTKPVELDEVKLLEASNNTSFAMYVGTDNIYEEYKGNLFPSGYNLNLDKSKCIDSNGNEIKDSLEESDNKIVLTTNKTAYCYLYFDEKVNLSNVCKDNNMQECLSNKKDEITTIENMSTDLVGDMYRYQGTSNVSNWICFGKEYNCGTNDDDIDKYMYRIIGITPNGELKLIKETFVREDDIKTFQWNDKHIANDCGYDGENCTWPDSKIFKRLNGISNGIVKGTDGDSNIFIGNSYYEYLNDDSAWLEIIEDRLWKYGNITNNSYNGFEVYNIESAFTTNATVLGTEPKGKIGLMYYHDYLYAYKTNDTDAGKPLSSENAKKAWVFFKNDGFNLIPDFEWLIVPRLPKDVGGGLYVPGNGIGRAGYVSDNAISNGYLSARPTFYLISTIKLSGLGTKDNPYIINV